jgi:NADPH:quinone reductase-like Zn-dependent oxidoreductase
LTFLGAPEVLQIIREPLTDPAAGEVRVRIEAFAVNPVDAMMRSGRLPTPGSPTRSRIGVEGTGVDIVLDLVRGPGQRDLLAATRTGGILVAAGFLDPRSATVAPATESASSTIADSRAHRRRTPTLRPGSARGPQDRRDDVHAVIHRARLEHLVFHGK